jgi:polysaccharide biosynthesis protein PslG
VARSLARWFAVLVAVATLAPVASASAAGPAFLGVYGEDSPGTPARAAAVAAAQRDAGVTVVRVPFIWSRIEPFPGILDFSQEDIVVGAAAKAGLDVLPFVIDAPAFLSVSMPLGYVRLPANAADLGVFAARVVHRYGPGGSFWAEHPDLPAHPIRAWQVWNEPNLVHNWYPRPDAAAYALLLKAAAAAIHVADPGAQVLAAGMPDSDNGVPFEEYVSGLYAAGAQESFDAFALNANAPTAQGTIDLVRYVRGLLDAHGDTRPFDVTEFGWSSGGPDKPQRTSEDGQAQNIGAVIRTLGTERDQLRLQRLIEFSWRDREVAAGMKDQWPYYTGLLRADASPKPALEAFHEAADALAHPAAAAAPAPASAVSSPRAPRRRVDHHPRVRVLGAGQRRAGGLIRPLWRVRVRCNARCMVRLRLVVPGRNTAGHVRVVLPRAGTQTLRVVARTRIRAHLAARRRPRFVLEVADIARTPLRVVARIRLAAVGAGG